ncbi:transcription factor 7-like 1-B [Leuresthes tenuis]|uniref:transcription factor 7-like 1-B n=1 Tax=Leuresthes tenuis TaxID=355514 RepID=UPI003B507CD9
MINGELMYETLPAAFLNTFISEKSQNDSKYIRKPPNAFMLFLKEQRPKILAANTFKDSVTTNKVAGEMWRSLTKEQQSKYYHQAQVEKRLHKQGNPEWSCKNNYGKRRNRHTLGSLSRTEAFGSEHSKPGKRSRVTPLRTEHPPCQSDLMQPHQAETPVNVLPVLHRSNLPQVCSACPAAPSQFCTNSEVVRGQV